MDHEHNLENPTPQPQQERRRPDLKAELFDWCESLTGALVVIVLLFAFFVRLTGVSGPSMKETLHAGDYLIVSDLFYTPKVGDIVIITKESFSEDSFVKRVIATGGQTVDIDFDSGEVWVDGVLLDEPYINTPTNRNYDVIFPVTVPEGHLFVMGDNRNESTDSRFSLIGMIDERQVVGRVLLRIWPLSAFGKVD